MTYILTQLGTYRVYFLFMHIYIEMIKTQKVIANIIKITRTATIAMISDELLLCSIVSLLMT